MLWQISQSISARCFLNLFVLYQVFFEKDFVLYQAFFGKDFVLYHTFFGRDFVLYHVFFEKRPANQVLEEYRSACTAQGDPQRLRNVAAHIAHIGFASVTLAMDLQADVK